MILFSVVFFPVNLNWQKLPQFLRKALGKTKITIGQYQFYLFLVKFFKRLCLSAFMAILNFVTFFIHFNLILGKSARQIMLRYKLLNQSVTLKKSFDTVNHSILLSKLNHYGVRGKTYDWFHSYLSNRKQFACINGHNSDSLSITCGVPQGSILGPLLFLLYINDLPNTSKLFSFYLFADDTNIYFSRKKLNDLKLILNQELHAVAEWMKSNSLALSGALACEERLRSTMGK